MAEQNHKESQAQSNKGRLQSKVQKRNRIVVIGGALSGPTAAARARESDESAEIILIEQNKRVSYALANLSLYLTGEVKSIDELNQEREDFFKNNYAIDVRTRIRVIGLDLKKKTLKIENDPNHEVSVIAFDKLIFTAGAASVLPKGLSGTPSNFGMFRTLDDVSMIRSVLESGRRRFVILGGGSMAAEAMDGLVRAGAQVTVIEEKNQFLPDYSKEIVRLFLKSKSKSVDIVTSVNDLRFDCSEDKIKAVIANGRRIETDYVVSAIGISPRTDLLKKAGITLLADGSIPVNRHCQTSHKHVYAAGVCVAVKDAFGDHRFIAQAALADKTAQVAAVNASNVAKHKISLPAVSASQLIRLPDLEIGRVGLTYKQAIQKYGKKNIDSSFVVGRDVEPYLKSQPMVVKIFYHTKTQRLVGIEVAGQNIKSRIDASAVAIAAKQKLSDLALIDLSYTTAIGTARDALNAAAMVGLQKIGGIASSVPFNEIIARRKDYLILHVSAKPTVARSEYDLHIPLESLRQRLHEVQDSLASSSAKMIATLSATGRRGHLAYRILRDAQFKVINISGGEYVID